MFLHTQSHVLTITVFETKVAVYPTHIAFKTALIIQ